MGQNQSMPGAPGDGQGGDKKDQVGRKRMPNGDELSSDEACLRNDYSNGS